jgi:D-alanyl-D-alanine carboxypeptidase
VLFFGVDAINANNGQIMGTLFRRGCFLICAALAAIAFLLPDASEAATRPDRNKHASLVVDGETGAVIRHQYANETRHPASLTKMMTLYIAFLALEKQKLRLKQQFTVSAHAAAQPPSGVGLRTGETVAVQDLILALIIKSANDAAAALAEGISGSEPRFAALMNKVAAHLGMERTRFYNASGLHDERQVTTAYDMARLAIALKRDFPQYYHLFKKTSFRFKGRLYASHNHVVRNYKWADGLKTGYVRQSGFNLVTTAAKGDKTLVGVVLGGVSARERDARMVAMLEKTFGEYKTNLASRSPGRAERKYVASVAFPTPELKPETVVAAGFTKTDAMLQYDAGYEGRAPAAPSPTQVGAQYEPPNPFVIVTGEGDAYPETIRKPKAVAAAQRIRQEAYASTAGDPVPFPELRLYKRQTSTRILGQ